MQFVEHAHGPHVSICRRKSDGFDDGGQHWPSRIFQYQSYCGNGTTVGSMLKCVFENVILGFGTLPPDHILPFPQDAHHVYAPPMSRADESFLKVECLE